VSDFDQDVIFLKFKNMVYQLFDSENNYKVIEEFSL